MKIDHSHTVVSGVSIPIGIIKLEVAVASYQMVVLSLRLYSIPDGNIKFEVIAAPYQMIAML